MNHNMENLIEKLANDKNRPEKLSSPAKRFLKWMALAFFYLSVALTAIGIRIDSTEFMRSPFLILETLTLIFLALSSAFSVFILSVPGSQFNSKKKVTLFPLLFWVLLITLKFIQTKEFNLTFKSILGFACINEILFVGVPVSLLLFFMVKKASPTSLMWSGWLAAISGVSLAGVGLQFTCSNRDILHIAISHLGPILTIGLIGILVGKKFLKW